MQLIKFGSVVGSKPKGFGICLREGENITPAHLQEAVC